MSSAPSPSARTSPSGQVEAASGRARLGAPRGAGGAGGPGRPRGTGRPLPGEGWRGSGGAWGSCRGAGTGAGTRAGAGPAARQPRRPSHLLRRRSRFLPRRSDRRPRSAARPGRPGRRPSSRLQNTGPAAAAAMETRHFRFRRARTLLTTARADTAANTWRRARARARARGGPAPAASVSPGGAAGAGRWAQACRAPDLLPAPPRPLPPTPRFLPHRGERVLLFRPHGQVQAGPASPRTSPKVCIRLVQN